MPLLKRMAPLAGAASFAHASSLGLAHCGGDGQAKKHPSMHRLSDFRNVVKSYDSKKEGYEDLGVNMAIQSHRAKVWKSRPGWSLLYCHLHPGCSWQSALVEVGEKWELRSAADPTADHNEECTDLRTIKGKTGFQTLEQRKTISASFTQSAVACRPRDALRAFNASQGPHEASAVALATVQRLKKTIVGDETRGKFDLGDLVQATTPYIRVPAAPHQGFFATREVRRAGRGGRPEFLLIATTKELLSRWAESTVACIDGGYKYNVMGYPLHLLGVVNPCGKLAVTGLGMTSTVSKDMIQDMLSKYADNAEKITGKRPDKEYGMSDGEVAYRHALKHALGCQNLMCWFHVTQAVRDWLGKHAQVTGKAKGTLWRDIVKPDLHELHFSSSAGEFQSKAAAILQRWDDIGVTAATTWSDATGKEHTLNSYFTEEWLQKASEWHWGHQRLLPSTNNATECNIRMAREDAGSVPLAMKEFTKFLISQVEYYSKLSWDARALPTPSKLVWSKATAFKRLFHTAKVLQHRYGSVVYHICRERSAPGNSDVTDRSDITRVQANRTMAIHQQLRAGEQVTYDDITFFSSMRVFWYEAGVDHCTCKAFPASQACFHTLALGLRAGRRNVPADCDDTGLCEVRPGKRKKMGDRYSLDEAAQELKMKETLLEDLASLRIRGLKRPAGTAVLKRPASDASAASGIPPGHEDAPEKRFRLAGKCGVWDSDLA